MVYYLQMTNIRFLIPKKSELELTIFDLRGAKQLYKRKIFPTAGLNAWQIELTGMASGIYFYRLNVRNENKNKFGKLIYIK